MNIIILKIIFIVAVFKMDYVMEKIWNLLVSALLVTTSFCFF